MTYPTFYDPNRIGTLFYPDMGRMAMEAREASLPPAGADTHTTHLVLIDMQIDFCHNDGNLNVPGALGDIQRIIEFIYRNSAHITHITCSLDSHLPQQIFSPNWWVDQAGNHPPPFTLITSQDIENGLWQPVIAPVASVNYVKRLEQEAKKVLTIWPYHTLMGSIGTALDPELWSAVMWHALARKTQPTWLMKGSLPTTEHYSIIRPEVPIPHNPMGDTNRLFLDTLAQADTIIVGGEASSHCVLESVADIVEDFADDPAKLAKLHILRDGMSPVVHPEIDFAALATAEFAKFEAQGVKFIESSTTLPLI